MKTRRKDGRALDQTPKQNPWSHAYVISVLALSVAAAGLAWSHSKMATMLFAGLIAVVAVRRRPTAPEKTSAEGYQAPRTRQKEIAIDDLNLTGESPTSRSDIKVFIGALTSATGRRATPEPLMVALGAVALVSIGWFGASSIEPAKLTMLTRAAVATAAVLFTVYIMTARQSADRRSLATRPGGTDPQKPLNKTATTKVELDVHGQDTGSAFRRGR
jgi:hypothetical protein